MALWVYKVDIEDRPDGLKMSFPYQGQPEFDEYGAVVVSIDNGIFELVVSSLPEGGYLVDLFHCEDLVFSEGVATNWEEFDPCPSCNKPCFEDPCEHCGHSEEFATEFGKDS